MIDPAYVIGIDPIDADHAELFALIEQVRQAGAEAEVALATVQALLDYTRRHFFREESLMAENGYPELEAHRQLHRALFRRVLEMEQTLGTGQAQAACDLAVFLNDWLRGHILVHDRRYGEFILDHP